MKKLSLLLFIAILFTGNIFAQSDDASTADDAFTKDMKHFFKINGSEATYQVAIKQMIGQFKTTMNTVPEEAWDKMEKEFSETSVDELFDMMIPVYKKHFTHDEVKELIAFYESDTGKKLANKTPIITEEAMLIGQKWGAEVGQKVYQSIQEGNY